MLKPRRKFPEGVKVKHPVDLTSYLPYRIHHLALKIGYVGKGVEGQPYDPINYKKYDLQVREWRLIVVIASYGPMMNAEIAEEAGMEAATVTRACKSLIKLGLIASQQLKNDKRKSLITLTKEGAKLFDAISLPRQKQIEKLESCLTKKERDTFYHLLDKLDNHAMLQIKESENPDIKWET